MTIFAAICMPGSGRMQYDLLFFKFSNFFEAEIKNVKNWYSPLFWSKLLI